MVSNKITFEKYKPAKIKSCRLEKSKVLKEKINKASKAIRKKYLALKLGKAEEDETLNRLLKPVIGPLKELKAVSIKDEKPTPPKKYISQEIYLPESKYDEEEESTPAEEATNMSVEQYPQLARGYIEGLFTKKKDYDETYGVRYDSITNKFYIGNMELHIGSNAEINIGTKTYGGNLGLYELLFKKEPNPKDYDQQDLQDYLDILKISSAHMRNYDPLSRINGTRSYKYTEIIKPLFKGKGKAHSGHGMNMVYNEKPIEYVYWDDVNELVDRLRLLNASKSAGNTDSHDNEILAIINELREAGVIY